MEEIYEFRKNMQALSLENGKVTWKNGGRGVITGATRYSALITLDNGDVLEASLEWLIANGVRMEVKEVA